MTGKLCHDRGGIWANAGLENPYFQKHAKVSPVRDSLHAEISASVRSSLDVGMVGWGLKSLVLGLVLLASTGCVSSTSRSVGESGGRIIVNKGIGLWRKPEIGGRTAVGIGWIDSLVVELPEDCRLVVVVRSTVEAERVAPILSALQNQGGLCVIPERPGRASVFSHSP